MTTSNATDRSPDLLVILTESPYCDQAVCFAERATSKSNGRRTLLAVASGPADEAALRQTLGASLSAENQVALKVRHGDPLEQVLAEIAEGNYLMALVGTEAGRRSPHQASLVTYLAGFCPIPLGIVRSCPSQWDRALVCAREPDLDLATVQLGSGLAHCLGLEPTVLHVLPAGEPQSDPSTDQPALSTPLGSIRWRQGPVVREILAEIEQGGYQLIVVGGQAAPLPDSSEPTLALPNVTYQIIQLALPTVIVIGQEAALAQAGMRPGPKTRPHQWGKAIRFAALELVIYAGLVIAYAAIAFRLLVRPLETFFQHNLTIYALLALLLIVGQGTLLEALTSFLLDRLRLERFE